MCYVVDTPRCASPSTFMSNMLYACSILYKSRLPLILVFNKTDSLRHEFAIEWMTNFDAFQDAVSHENSYMSGLTRSMSLVLDEFYRNLRVRLTPTLSRWLVCVSYICSTCASTLERWRVVDDRPRSRRLF